MDEFLKLSLKTVLPIKYPEMGSSRSVLDLRTAQGQKIVALALALKGLILALALTSKITGLGLGLDVLASTAVTHL